MFKRFILIVTLFSTFLSGCATPDKSISLGSGIGIGVGAGIGALAASQGRGEQQMTGTLIGALVGGIAGGLIGNESYKAQRKKELEKGFDPSAAHMDMFGNASSSSAKPTLKPAQVRVRYVEDLVKDGTFIPAHFEYDISDPAHWEGAK